MAEAGPAGDESLGVMELEYVIGFSGRPGTLLFLPGSLCTVVYAVGSSVVISQLEKERQSFLRGHDSEVCALATSADGSLVASGQQACRSRKSDEAAVIVWDVEGERQMYQLFGLMERVVALSFSPDGRLLLGADSRILYVWDLRSGETVVTYKTAAPTLSICWLGMLGDERRPTYVFASGSNAGVKMFKLEWDLRALSYALTDATFRLPSRGLVRAHQVCLPDASGAYLLTGTDGGDACVFDIASKRYCTSVPLASLGVTALAVAGGTMYAACGDGSVLRLAGVEAEWEVVASIALSGEVSSLSASPDGSLLIAGTSYGRIYQLDPSEMAVLGERHSHTASIAAISFAPNSSSSFASIDVDGCLSLWSLEDYSRRCRVREAADGTAVLLSGDASAAVLSGWSDGFLRAYDSVSGDSLWSVPTAHRGPVTSLAATDAAYLSGGQDGAIRMWAKSTRVLLAQWTEHRKAIVSLCADVSREAWVHSTSADKSVVTYDLKRERRFACKLGHAAALTCAAQRPDSENELLTADLGGEIVEWDPELPESLRSFRPCPRVAIASIAVSPSGRFLAVASADGCLQLFAIADFTLLGRLRPSSSALTAVAWSPDEKQMVAAAQDGSLSVLNWYGPLE
eukprot:PLAT4737.1.p1 GENE.PLAT4737.1~~PLAT4737.1.p1  ORF type:complete len:649 (+),score=293.22 PLAT4737.1:63-1949(+)